ncbi:oligosaccharide flippase family protein [Rhodovibrio salinarum]|uniref:oligosaccharide flippase family protein n=1 Tax=Rhodovibrio salinarum TaxID=1087 RepID=UPI00048A14C7|nr:oligosaccharide flippase family protein [Rhodovibrio salinarum]
MSIRKSLAWSFSQSAGQKLIQFVGSIFVARLLTPDEVGVFSIAMAMNYLLGSFREFGAVNYLIREPNLTPDKIRTAFAIMIVIQWSLGGLLLAVRSFLAEFYGEPGIADVLTVVALGFFISPFGQPAIGLLRRAMRFDLLHHISIFGVVVGTTTTIVLAFLDFSYMALAWGVLAGNVVRSVLPLCVQRDHLMLVPGFSHWREILSFGGFLALAGICGTSASDGRKFILGAFISPAAIALVERAEQIPRTSREALFLPIGRVLLSSFSKDIREGRSIGPSVEAYVGALTIVTWPAFAALSALAVPVIVLLFGENWRVAGEILPFLLLAAGLPSALPQPEQILISHGAVRRLFVLRLCQLVVAIAVSTVGAYYGLVAFAVSQILIAAVLLGIVYFFIGDLMETSLTRLLPSYIHAAGLSVVCASPPAMVYWQYGDGPPVSWVLGALALSAASWIGGIMLLRHPLSLEVRHLWGRVAQRL